MSADAVAVLVRAGERRRLGACEREALRAALAAGAALELPVLALAAGDPDRVRPALALALRAGCERALELPDAGDDYLALARTLAAAIDEIGARLIVCGDLGEDSRRGAIGPAVAEELGWPHLSGIVELAAHGREIRCRRRAAGCSTWFGATPPAVLCVRTAGPIAVGAAPGGRAGIETLAIEASPGDPLRAGEPVEVRHHRRATLFESPAALVRRLKGDRYL